MFGCETVLRWLPPFAAIAFAVRFNFKIGNRVAQRRTAQDLRDSPQNNFF